MIEDYKTGGTDPFDQMYTQYSCSRKTRRWPFCVFFGMLNTTATNAWIIHSENALRRGEMQMAWRKFIDVLSLALSSPLLCSAWN